MKILALSGSLRVASVNTAMLRAAAKLAPQDMEIRVFSGLGDLPLFNPDCNPDGLPAVRAFYNEVVMADALIIASPEYAHGVSGVIKNALDWLVSFEPFAGKPVAVINTSPRAQHADAALREILTTMAAVIVEPASINIALLGTQLTEEAIASSPKFADAIKNALTALQNITPVLPTALAKDIRIHAATQDDASTVAVMVGELLDEIMSAIGVPAFNFNLDETQARLENYIAQDKYFVFVARDDGGHPVGFIALYESQALYAEGSFGTIPELYVCPGQRSQSVGGRLIAAAVNFAKKRGWRRLEVTSPPLPQFDKTLAFYQREGFSIAGGRKLKRTL